MRYTRALTVLRVFSGQIPLSYNSTHLPLKDVALLSFYQGKFSRGHHKILNNYPRTKHPENTTIFLKVTQACFYNGSWSEFLRHLPRDSENRPRGMGVMESLQMKPVLAGHSSNARNMLSTLLAFQVKDPDKLLKIHHQYFPFPEVKVVASSKPPWRKGINKTTLKPKQLTRDLGWHKPLDAVAINFSWVGVSPAKAHARATRRSCSGLAVVRRHCKQSTNTGLCWGLGRRRSSPPSDSWNCSAGNPSLHLKWIQVSQLPTSDQGGLSPVLLSPASSTFSKDEMTILVYFSAQVIITFSSLKKNQTQNQHARSHCFSLRSKTFNIGLKKSQWRIWWWCFSKSK